MKTYFLAMLSLVLTSSLGLGQLALPEAALTLEVVDESGKPIAGARSSIRAQDTQKDLQIVGETDEKGVFSAQLPSFGYFYYSTGADGYSVEESDLDLTWSFPNAGDGIIVYPYEGGARSGLRSPTQAPEEGYLATITVDAEGRPKGQVGESRPLSFVFRVRTVLDDAGNVLTAHYGKIYPEAYKVVYYFNPTVNSRALEFDLKRNLVKGLKSYEQINEP